MEAKHPTPQIELNPQNEVMTVVDADSLRGKNCLLAFEFHPDENHNSFRTLSSQLAINILNEFCESLMNKWSKKDLEQVLIGEVDLRVKAGETLYEGVPVLLQWSTSIDLFTKPPPIIISHPTFNFRIKTIFAKSSHPPSQQKAFKDTFGIFDIYQYTEEGLVKIEKNTFPVKREKPKSRNQALSELTPRRDDNALTQDLDTFSGMKRVLEKTLEDKKKGEDKIKELTEENERLTKRVAGYEKFFDDIGSQEVARYSQSQLPVLNSTDFSNVTLSRGKSKK